MDHTQHQTNVAEDTGTLTSQSDERLYVIVVAASYLGTVENHGKKWQKTRQTFVKIAKITAKSRHQITGPQLPPRPLYSL